MGWWTFGAGRHVERGTRQLHPLRTACRSASLVARVLVDEEENDIVTLQRYISRELTHFVGRGREETVQYETLVKILNGGLLTPLPGDPERAGMSEVHINNKLSDETMFLGRVVCFCDIPVADLDIHMSKYSRFGVAFNKEALVAKGANPVYYIAKNPGIPRPRSIQEVLRKVYEDLNQGKDANESLGETVSRVQIFDEMLPLHHELFAAIKDAGSDRLSELGVRDVRTVAAIEGFHDTYIGFFLKPFDSSLLDDDPDNVYMEREWRVLGNLTFTLDEVVRVIVPEAYARRFRDDVPSYYGQIHFPD